MVKVTNFIDVAIITQPFSMPANRLSWRRYYFPYTRLKTFIGAVIVRQLFQRRENLHHWCSLQ